MHPTRAGGLIAEEPREHLSRKRRGMLAMSTVIVLLGVVVPVLLKGSVGSIVVGFLLFGLGAYVLVWSLRMTPVRVYQNGIEHYGTLGLELLTWDRMVGYRDANGLMVEYDVPVGRSLPGSRRTRRTVFIPDSTSNFLAVSGFVKQMVDESGGGGSRKG